MVANSPLPLLPQIQHPLKRALPLEETEYGRGKFNNEPTEEGALKDRIEKLERLVGKLTLENEFLKKGLHHSISQSQRNGKSSPDSSISSGISGGGVD